MALGTKQMYALYSMLLAMACPAPENVPSSQVSPAADTQQNSPHRLWCEMLAHETEERFCHTGTVLLGRSLTDLQDFAQANGQPKFRGKQLYDGLVHGVHNVLDFNNVRHLHPESCRAVLPMWAFVRMHAQVPTLPQRRATLQLLSSGGRM